MKKKVGDIIRKNMRWLKIAGVFIICSLMIFMFYELMFNGENKPIKERIADESGRVELSNGKVYDIEVKLKDNKEPINDLNLSINVVNGLNEVIFQKDFENINLSSKEYTHLLILDQQSCLDWGTGKFSIVYTADTINENELIVGIWEEEASYSHLIKAILITILVFILIVLIMFAFPKVFLIHRMYFVIVILLGILYTLILPPLTGGDEKVHFAKAYEISNRLMFEQVHDEEGFVLVRQTDFDSTNTVMNGHNLYQWYENLKDAGFSKERVSYDIRSTVDYIPSYVYLPQAIGITIAKLLSLNGSWLMVFGRLGNLLFCAFIMTMAIKIIPKGKYAYSLLGLFPTILGFSNAFTYDGFNYSLLLLAIAIFVKILLDTQLSKRWFIFMTVVFLLVLPIKVVYFPFGVMLLMVPHSYFSKRKEEVIYKIGAVLIIFAFFFILRSKDLTYYAAPAVQSTVSSGEENPILYSVSWCLQNIGTSIEIYIKTFFSYSFFDLAEKAISGPRLNFRYGSIYWYYSPFAITTGILMTFIIGVIFDPILKKESICLQKHTFRVIIVGTYLLIMTSMFVAYTYVGNDIIDGLQGRYFSPLFLLIPLAFIGSRQAPEGLNENNYLQSKIGIGEKLLFVSFGLNILNVMYIFEWLVNTT